MGVLGVPCGADGASASRTVRAVLLRGSCLFWGARGSFLWVCLGPVGPFVTTDTLLVLLGAYRGAGVGACAAGLRLSWPFLDFLLGGFGKIQLTQIIQFVIYLHKVGNADAKCHEIQFSNKCFLFVNFLILFVNICSRNLIILLMLCL